LSAVPFWHWPINDAKVTDMSQNNLSSSKTCAQSLALEITCIVYYLGDYYETKGDGIEQFLGGKIWSNVIDIRLQKSAGCAAGTFLFSS
jgi:hypothetical protein